MPIIRALRRVRYIPRRAVRELLGLTELVWLSLVNRYGRAPVTRPGGPVVSLTTFGKRSRTVHLAIESIARGRVLPSRMILWIDDEAIFRSPPPALRRLQRRGLEIKSCANYGPHKKYYPYVASQEAFHSALVTADDDVLYPRYWLQKLVEGLLEHPETVNCCWASVVAVNEEGVGKYADWFWNRCESPRPSFCHVALGAHGIIYPPSFLTVLKRAGRSFELVCPRNDDVWLHVQAIRAGYRVRQVLPRLPYFSFQGIPGTAETALSRENLTHGNGTDLDVKAAYKETDIQLLRADRALTRGRFSPIVNHG